MSPWWRKPEPPAPEVVEQIEAIEVPVITEAKRHLAKGEYVRALTTAYPKAAVDVARAFHLPFPPGMTHEEFLGTCDRPEMGHLPEFFRRLYSLYAPLRYGPATTSTGDPAALQGILESLYAHRAMAYLYLDSREAGVVTIRSPQGASVDPDRAGPAPEGSAEVSLAPDPPDREAA